MTGAPSADPAQLINEIEDLLDQVVELDNSLEIYQGEDGEPEPPPDDSSTHRKRAKMALILIDIRDRGERLLARVGDGPPPAGLDYLLTRLMAVLSYFDKPDEGRAFYDGAAKILPPERSAWYLAEAAISLVNAYLAQNRYDEAVEFYRRSLDLNRYEEAAIGLVRAAFYLVSTWS